MKSPSSPRFRQVLASLRSLGRPDQLRGMARFGLAGEGRLGASMPALRALAKTTGKDHALADRLWNTAIPEAMILASLVGEPAKLTSRQMDRWVSRIGSWDVCDQACSNLFDRSPLAWKKIRIWTGRKEEFVRRAGYVLIAALALHDKQAPDTAFLDLLPAIRKGATDERNFVRKAVNWALRQIGKRNLLLRAAAIKEAEAIRQLPSSGARWIASDALRELQGAKTLALVKARSRSRPAR